MNEEERKVFDFLSDVQLEQFYGRISGELHITRLSHFDHVYDSDLMQLGMARPEIRRLFDALKRHKRKAFFTKLKKSFRRTDDQVSTNVTLWPKSSTDIVYVPHAPVAYHASQHAGLAEDKKGLRCLINECDLALFDLLGKGAFGYVRSGEWTTESGKKISVAVKCLRSSSDVSIVEMQNEFIKEANGMSSLDHPNLIRLYGIVLTTPMMLVTELAPLGSLLKQLRNNPDKFLVASLCSFVVQIVAGMKYLEKHRLVHRDLAARNILLMSFEKVKIGDFGLMRPLPEDMGYYIMQPDGLVPFAWCAPECLKFRKFSHASDVWAFGITVVELFSYGAEPWPGLNGAQILEKIDTPSSLRPACPQHCPVDLYRVVSACCWNHDPNERRAFSELEKMLLEALPGEVKALYSCQPTMPNLLAFSQGDTITVIDSRTDAFVWKGQNRSTKKIGTFPANLVDLTTSLSASKVGTGVSSWAGSFGSSIRNISPPIAGSFFAASRKTSLVGDHGDSLPFDRPAFKCRTSTSGDPQVNAKDSDYSAETTSVDSRSSNTSSSSTDSSSACSSHPTSSIRSTLPTVHQNLLGQLCGSVSSGNSSGVETGAFDMPGACSCLPGACSCLPGACSCLPGSSSCPPGACSCLPGACSCLPGACSCLRARPLSDYFSNEDSCDCSCRHGSVSSDTYHQNGGDCYDSPQAFSSSSPGLTQPICIPSSSSRRSAHRRRHKPTTSRVMQSSVACAECDGHVYCRPDPTVFMDHRKAALFVDVTLTTATEVLSLSAPTTDGEMGVAIRSRSSRFSEISAVDESREKRSGGFLNASRSKRDGGSDLEAVQYELMQTSCGVDAVRSPPVAESELSKTRPFMVPVYLHPGAGRVADHSAAGRKPTLPDIILPNKKTVIFQRRRSGPKTRPRGALCYENRLFAARSSSAEDISITSGALACRGMPPSDLYESVSEGKSAHDPHDPSGFAECLATVSGRAENDASSRPPITVNNPCCSTGMQAPGCFDENYENLGVLSPNADLYENVVLDCPADSPPAVPPRTRVSEADSAHPRRCGQFPTQPHESKRLVNAPEMSSCNNSVGFPDDPAPAVALPRDHGAVVDRRVQANDCSVSSSLRTEIVQRDSPNESPSYHCKPGNVQRSVDRPSDFSRVESESSRGRVSNHQVTYATGRDAGMPALCDRGHPISIGASACGRSHVWGKLKSLSDWNVSQLSAARRHTLCYSSLDALSSPLQDGSLQCDKASSGSPQESSPVAPPRKNRGKKKKHRHTVYEQLSMRRCVIVDYGEANKPFTGGPSRSVDTAGLQKKKIASGLSDLLNRVTSSDSELPSTPLSSPRSAGDGVVDLSDVIFDVVDADCSAKFSLGRDDVSLTHDRERSAGPECGEKTSGFSSGIRFRPGFELVPCSLPTFISYVDVEDRDEPGSSVVFVSSV